MSQCDGKKAFPSRHQAQECADFCRRKGLGLSKDHRPYHCEICFHWHIGRPAHGFTSKEHHRQFMKERAYRRNSEYDVDDDE